MEFKIIAITPLKDCSPRFLKVLEEDKDYLLYTNYQIYKNRIHKNETLIPDTLYKINSNAKVNISAIVGKNGSGKSTIIELLYAVIFNVSWLSGILPKVDDDGNPIKPELGVKARIYYQSEENYYCITSIGKDISYKVQKGNGKFSKSRELDEYIMEDIKTLFFTIVINYSHYSLNSKSHKWLKYLFHKNDGYQTPIVINPFRKDGIIDINNEQDLTNARIVASLLTLTKAGESIIRELVPGKKASHLKFTLNKKKLLFRKEELLLKRSLEDHKDEILDLVFDFFNLRERPKSYSTEDPNLSAAYMYICKKLVNITIRYKPYQGSKYEFLSKIKRHDIKTGDATSYKFSINKLHALLKKMSEEPSHITFKLRQAINFVDNINFYEDKIGKFIPIDVFAKHLRDFRNTRHDSKQDLITVIPPSFFAVDIQFEKKGTLQSLSSGEKQNLYSSGSWMYHIINLASVREEHEVGYRKYRNISLVFDEIELYYHPEMQREFIQSFLNNLERLNLGNEWGINAIFITHSPFILSDIPNEHILFLTQDGKIQENAGDCKTFGANIHDILKNNFFLEKGTIGAFAQSKINELIEDLKDQDSEKWSKNDADLIINLISEPLIRQGLRTLFNKKFSERSAFEIKRQIESLQKELSTIITDDSN
jgi:energy-coupling factor transporter ATP-binding protein EcfA2